MHVMSSRHVGSENSNGKIVPVGTPILQVVTLSVKDE